MHGSQPESHIKSWLLDRQSLTKRLKERSRRSFRVRVDRQQWQRPRYNERQVLGMPDRSIALVRTVHLLVDETPVVYARTVIPESTLTRKYGGLGGLGSRPLGEVLFANRTMKREQMTFSKIKRGQELYNEALRGVTDVCSDFWGRRSLSWLKNESLLLSEFFLPAINELKG